jgi:hypothetical protein
MSWILDARENPVTPGGGPTDKSTPINFFENLFAFSLCLVELVRVLSRKRFAIRQTFPQGVCSRFEGGGCGFILSKDTRISSAIGIPVAWQYV